MDGSSRLSLLEANLMTRCSTTHGLSFLPVRCSARPAGDRMAAWIGKLGGKSCYHNDLRRTRTSRKKPDLCEADGHGGPVYYGSARNASGEKVHRGHGMVECPGCFMPLVKRHTVNMKAGSQLAVETTMP